jgi:two-component system, NarL family, response regulator NreC
MSTSLLIADDQTVFREAISLWLRQSADVEVVGLAENGRMAVDMACRLHPDVVLMDMTMPQMNGIDATRLIVQETPDTKVVILAETVSSRSVHDALEAGAVGYVSKCCSAQEVIRAIHEVMSEGTYLSPAASSVVVRQYLHGHGANDSSLRASLTARERQIVQLIAEGHSIKEIGRELTRSPKTIDWHKSQVMKKLGIDTTASLVRYAIIEGLTSLDLTPLAVS